MLAIFFPNNFRFLDYIDKIKNILVRSECRLQKQVGLAVVNLWSVQPAERRNMEEVFLHKLIELVLTGSQSF